MLDTKRTSGHSYTPPNYASEHRHSYAQHGPHGSSRLAFLRHTAAGAHTNIPPHFMPIKRDARPVRDESIQLDRSTSSTPVNGLHSHESSPHVNYTYDYMDHIKEGTTHRSLAYSDASDPDEDIQVRKCRRARRKMCHRCTRLLRIPYMGMKDVVEAIMKLVRRIRNVRKIFYEWDYDLQQKIMFAISTLLGCIVFILLFESIHLTLLMYMADMAAPGIWMLAYVLAYIVSIVWQHSLNQCLVFPQYSEDSYCESLFQTFTVYAVTLLLTTICGAVMMSGLRMMDHPQVVMIMTLPLSGICNFYLLQWCMDYSHGNIPDSDIIIL